MIRWGIIGCGRISHRFMEGFKAVPGCELVSVWSRRAETVDSFVELYGGMACGSVEELLASKIDAVYIATLPDSHASYSIAALKAGKHVLCEKPTAVNLIEVNQILEITVHQNRLFMEGMKPPFYPLYKKLKEHLQHDPIGDIGYVRAGSSVVDCPPEHPNYSHDLVGGGLMQIGIYEAFLAVDWLGAAEQVQSMGRFGETGVDMFSIFQSRHQNGYAQVYCGFDLHGKGDALICGTHGHVTIHKNWWNPSKATINYADGREIELDEPFIAGGLNYELEHFCKLIDKGLTESSVMSHDISRKMISLIDKAREAIGLKFNGK